MHKLASNNENKQDIEEMRLKYALGSWVTTKAAPPK
jgi:hypothetical protein